MRCALQMSQGSRYQKVKIYEDKRRLRKGAQPRKNFDAAGGVQCKDCFKLKNENDILKEELKILKIRLYQYEKTTKKDVANAHTPSSKIPYKKNSKEDLRGKKGGAVLGHKGSGRSSATIESADEVIKIAAPEICGDCHCKLNQKDIRERTVIESVPIIAKEVIYHCERSRCPKCFKVYAAKPPVLPKSLYGNSLIAQAAVMHFVHGITIGKVLNILGENVGLGGIIDCFHRLGKISEGAKDFLINEYRTSNVKHADETGWRTDGHSGYAWIFCTPQTTIFEFKDNRSSRVPREILGGDLLPGVLVVDRYPGYNSMPVKIQYCYAHLLREVNKLEEDFREEKEVIDFSGRLASELTAAMKLHGYRISDEEYYLEAEKIRQQIESLATASHSHLGIKRIQQIFNDHRGRLFHWVRDRSVPSENNRAERELRPTVIARKVSFGSQSDAGAKTRSSIMSLLYTVKKRLKDKSLEEWLTDVLNKVAIDPKADIKNFIPNAVPSN